MGGARLIRSGGLAIAVLGVCAIAPAASTAAPTCEGAETDPSNANAPKLERTLLCLTNIFRDQNGLQPLSMDSRLQEAAHQHAIDIGTYNLTSAAANPPDGNPHYNSVVPAKFSPQDRADLAGYTGGVGENIAWSGFPGFTPQAMIEAWKASAGHRANLLGDNPDTPESDNLYLTAGMGIALSRGINAVQMFGVEPGNSDDIAVDLLITDACADDEQAVTKAKVKVRKARKKVRRADTNAEERAAKRKLKKAKRKLAGARSAAAESCNPQSY